MPEGIFKWSDGISGSDASAIHDDQPGEINAITEKTTPADNDLFIIEDSAASYAKKKLKKSNLIVAGADTTAIHDNESGEINAITEKTTPIGNDIFLIEDSEASYAKKKIIISSFFDGWFYFPTQPTYVSSTIINITGDVRQYFNKGTKISFIQSSTVKYFYVIKIELNGSDTRLTITGGTDYTLTNNTITAFKISNQSTPAGFPFWFNTSVGWVSDGTQPALGNATNGSKFRLNGNTCHWLMGYQCGTTTTYGTGNYAWTLPIPCVSTVFLLTHKGIVNCRDASPAAHIHHVAYLDPTASTTQLRYVMLFSSTNTIRITPTVPFTWATSDYFMVDLQYQIE